MVEYFARVQSRFLETLYCSPKIFFCAFLWQGFGLSCDCSDHLVGYYFLTGLGGAVGTLVGHLLFYLARAQSHHHVKAEVIRGSLYALSAFLGPATAWQRVANDAADWDWSFTSAFFFMWLISGLIFFASMQFFRKLAEYLSEYNPVFKVIDPQLSSMIADFTLSISVGLGDAFFLSTLASDFDGNWLKPAFGVNSETDDFVAMIKAGASATIGFFLAQVVQNFCFSTTWADKSLDDEADPIRSSLIGKKSHSTSVSSNTSTVDSSNQANSSEDIQNLELTSNSKKEHLLNNP